MARHPPVAMSVASRMQSRCNSASPYTAPLSNAGRGCGHPYHVGYARASRSRKSAPRSMTSAARPRRWSMCWLDSPCSNATNSTSAVSRLSRDVKRRSVRPRSGGCVRSTRLPVRRSDVTWTTLTLGWSDSRRRSSPPAYPAPPTTAARITVCATRCRARRRRVPDRGSRCARPACGRAATGPDRMQPPDSSTRARGC